MNLVVLAEEREYLARRAAELPAVQISERSMCDLELLVTGGFSPLDRFMSSADYTRVLEEMRLADGTLFPIPITLPLAEPGSIQIGREVALRSPKNELMAIMRVDEVFEAARGRESELVYGTFDTRHPLVNEMAGWGTFCMSGPITALNTPPHSDFPALRRTPRETRAILESLDHANVVAFQTRNPLHRAHEELTKRAAMKVDGALLIHPVVGMARRHRPLHACTDVQEPR